MTQTASTTADTRLRILLVEDDEIDQMAFRRYVDREKLPYTYLIVASVSDAEKALRDYAYDVILSDFQLGDGNGLDVLSLAGKIPVIMVTGAGGEEIAVRAMKAGAYDYIVKDMERRYLPLIPMQIENALKRHQAEAQAEQLMSERVRRETLEQFIRDVSHDLRTPLSSFNTSIYLLGRYTDTLMEMVHQPNVTADVLEVQVKRVQERCVQLKELETHFERMILDMIEMVRIDTTEQFTFAPSNLNHVLEVTVSQFAERALSRRQKLTFHPSPVDPIATISMPEFASALRNLLTNAIAYTGEGGTVDVSTAVEGDRVRIAVQDTGIGIPAEDVPYIFDRFYRVDKSRTIGTGSSGLGLSIVKRVAELHHGAVTVESTLGVGSTFTLSLPLG